jgi:hypothetical protein
MQASHRLSIDHGEVEDLGGPRLQLRDADMVDNADMVKKSPVEEVADEVFLHGSNEQAVMAGFDHTVCREYRGQRHFQPITDYIYWSPDAPTTGTPKSRILSPRPDDPYEMRPPQPGAMVAVPQPGAPPKSRPTPPLHSQSSRPL